MSNAIANNQHAFAEIVGTYEEPQPNKPGVFVRFGTTLDNVLRTSVSFVRALPLLMRDTFRKVRNSTKLRTGFSKIVGGVMWAYALHRFPVYVFKGIAICGVEAKRFYLNLDGKKVRNQDGSIRDHYHTQATTTHEDKAIDAYDKWKNKTKTSRDDHGKTIIKRWLVTAGILAVVVSGLAVAPWSLLPMWLVLPLIGIASIAAVATIVKFGRIGKAGVLLEQRGFDYDIDEEVTCEFVQDAFSRLRLPVLNNAVVKCITPIVEFSNGEGWKTEVRLPRGVTVTKDVIPVKDRLASALGDDIDPEQVILKKAKGERVLSLEVSYLKPSERPPAVTPYLTMRLIESIVNIRYGVDNVGNPSVFKQSHGTLVTGESGKGKSNGLYSLAAPYLLHPRGVVDATSFKLSADLETLFDLARIAINGDGTRDREAMAMEVRSLMTFQNEGVRRARLLKKRGISEVTEEMLLNDPDFFPYLHILDEGQFFVRDEEHGEEMRTFLDGLLETIRYTGLKLVITTQKLSPNGIDHNFSGIFPTKIVYKSANNAEVTTLIGNDAVRMNLDSTKFNRAGQCALVSDDQEACNAYHWLPEHKEELKRLSLVAHGGVIEKISLEKPSPTTQEPTPVVDSNVMEKILAIRDECTFGDKGIWTEEYPELARMLGIDVKTLKEEIKAAKIGSKGFKKESANGEVFNRSGLLFELINPTQKEQ